MEEYVSNSLKSKEQEPIPEKKVEKVVSGTVTRKKKNEVEKFAGEVFSEDIRSVKNYILMDVLVPSLKKAISDIVTNGIDILLYGESGHSKNRSGSKPSYRNYYDDKNSTSYRPTRSVYSFDDIGMESKGDAEEVLDGMIDILNQYGMVSVADMYDLVGAVGNYTDNKYGWTDLRNAYTERGRDGRYYVRLPRVIPLK